MARPIDQTRRTALLHSAVDYISANGLTDLSFRPLADALGVSTTTLVHHFGTKEQLLSAVLNEIRSQVTRITERIDTSDADMTSAARYVWQWSTSTDQDALFRTFFAAYGLALAHPDRFADFLDAVVSDWLHFLHRHYRRDSAEITLTIAVIRGLLLDLLTTGDRERVNEAFDEFIRR